MPMDIEFCDSCGCSEFSHFFVSHECDEDCDEDCELVDEEPEADCECGACGDYSWMENPHGAVCQCGCPEDRHQEAGSACERCDSCGGYVEWGSELELLREQLAVRGTEWPSRSRRSTVSSSTIVLSWTDEPLEIVGALVADATGQPTRRAGLPRPEDEVFVYFVVTLDGLEIAVTADEITGAHH